MTRRSTFARRAIGVLSLALAGFATVAPAAPSPAALSVPAGPGTVRLASDGGDCGWFAVVASSRSYGGVATTAADAGGYVIDTNDVPEFTPNLYAAVRGPFDRAFARQIRNDLRRGGFGDAYIKFGCRY